MLIAKQDFWNDADQATRLLKERTSLSGTHRNLSHHFH